MAIIIRHRFIPHKILSDKFSKVNSIIIGTFNPGHPDMKCLNSREKKAFSKIDMTVVNEIGNFYDRSGNRFWKVMDILDDPKFYGKNYSKINLTGLKYYKSKKQMNREETNQRQKSFAVRNGIFITDIVKLIRPTSFDGIYSGYSDDVIDKSDPEWHTTEIIKLIKKYSVKNLYSTFQFPTDTIENISEQLQKIEQDTRQTIRHLASPSGAKRNSYTLLVDNWTGKLDIKASS